ncbi:mCpol domain-containing protein [Aquimarina sp. AU474]|uniref:mCpol domain-containing protein n=1 Tax=Aquimarina sp. AU474 TaxID=2108529 RepID=UPI000D6873AA|nr:mCpol domain-containing protein [Aquimarina sp. AU474]
MGNNIFIRLDVDNAGDSIELALLKSDPKKAQRVHDSIQENINLIVEMIHEKHTRTVLMKGSDDILFSVNKNEFDINFLKKIKSEFKLRTGFSISIGIGSTITQCLLNLRIAKVSGKDKIVENKNR